MLHALARLRAALYWSLGEERDVYYFSTRSSLWSCGAYDRGNSVLIREKLFLERRRFKAEDGRDLILLSGEWDLEEAYLRWVTASAISNSTIQEYSLKPQCSL